MNIKTIPHLPTEKDPSHMATLKTIVKSVLPKTWISAIKASRRNYVFRRAMRQFIRNPERSIAPDSRVLVDLIYGWGNESWSAGTDYLCYCIKNALTSRGSILECGSGLTTLLLAVIAQKNGTTYWTLEHQSEWSERVTDYLKKFRIALPNVHVKPLRDYGEFYWYDPPVDMLPAHFDLVVCDGPPGATLGGRYGLSPVLGQRLRNGCLILLDDAERKQERDIADRWRTELNAEHEFIDGAKPFIAMRTKP